MLELFLPPKGAKAAIPVLLIVTLAGTGLVVARAVCR